MKVILKFLKRLLVWAIEGILMLTMLIIILVNLSYANVLGEQCGNIHPSLFVIEAASIDELTSYKWSAPNNAIPSDIPHNDPDMNSSAPDYADLWRSCIEYYGYVGETGFIINIDGIQLVAGGASADNTLFDVNSIVATIELSDTGKIMLYLIFPSLVILLPIITVFFIKREWGIIWFIMLFLVAAHVLTTSLLYVHLSNVSGIDALAEFAYGIFGGTTTGTAIAFMTRVLENFGSDDKSEELLRKIEGHLSNGNPTIGKNK